MKTEDTNAIKSFNDKTHHYLMVVGKKGDQHLKIARVSFVGRIFMKLGCHRAAMKKVINYLEKHADNELEIDLKKKVFEKLNSYSTKHKIPISTKLQEILTGAKKTDEKGDLDTSITDQQSFDKLYDTNDKLQALTENQIHLYAKFMTIKHFEALNPEIAEKLKYKTIQAFSEQQLEDFYVLYPDAIHDLKEDELNDLMGKFPDLMIFSNISDKQIEFLDPKKITLKTSKAIFGPDSPSAKNTQRVAFLRPKQAVELFPLFGINHCKELSDEQIRELDPQKINQESFNKIFAQADRINLLSKEQILVLAKFMKGEHLELLDSGADIIPSLITSVFSEDQLNQFFKIFPDVIRDLNKDQLLGLIEKFPNLSAYGNISDEQIKFLDPSKLLSETFSIIFGYDTPDDKKGFRIAVLSSDQVNALLQQFGANHCENLDSDQIAKLDPQKIDQEIFDKIFTHLKFIPELADENIPLLAKYMRIEHFEQLDADQLALIKFDTIDTLSADNLAQFYKKYPQAIRALSKDELNKLLKKYPDSNVFKRISDDQIGYLDPALITKNCFEKIFGPDLLGALRLQRIQFLSADQVVKLFELFGTNHNLALRQEQIQEMDPKLLDKKTFLKIFNLEKRVNWLSEEQLFHLAKYMSPKQLLAISNDQTKNMHFRTIMTLTEQQLGFYYEKNGNTIQRLNKDELNELIEKFPKSPIYESISDAQIADLNPSKMTRNTFSTVFGYNAPGIKNTDRVKFLIPGQLEAMLPFFESNHLLKLNDSQIQALDPQKVPEKEFTKLFINLDKLKLITETQMKEFKKYLLRDDIEKLSDTQKKWV